MIDGRALAEGEGWGPAFPVGEYGERVEKVRREMARRGIDVLLVSSPPNITYLTGYDMIWYYLTSPVSVAVHADSGQTLFFEVPYHQPTVEWHAVVDDAEYFGDGQSPAESIVSSLKGRGWLNGNVGVEEWSRAPSGVVINEIKRGFADAGANVVDGSWVVDRVRLIKSAPEIKVMRKAASIADKAMETVLEVHIRPGVMETELAGVALHAMMKEGGGDPAIRAAVRSGPRFCGSALGAEPSEAAAGRPGLDQPLRVISSVPRRPGSAVLAGRAFVEVARADGQDLRQRRSRDFEGADRETPQAVAQKAMDEYMDSMGLRPYVAYVSGYNMGIAIPPDWVGHTFIDPDTGFETARYDPGMITNYENLFTVLDTDPGWKGWHGRRLHRDDPDDRQRPWRCYPGWGGM